MTDLQKSASKIIALQMKIRAFFSKLIFICILPLAANAHFFSERYRGWFWFENKQDKDGSLREKISPTEAKKETENLRIQMDEKRHVMIARPSAKNVVEYIKLEQKMWDRALKLDEAFREAKFKYPEYFDKLDNPTNVHAVKFKRKLERDKGAYKIRDFASKYDLILFTSKDCKYSKIFAPALKKFAEQYGFVVEEVSIQGSPTGLFRGRKLPDLASRLGVKNTPVTIAISKDGLKAFEMIRGYASIAELEEYSQLALNYGEHISQNIR